jgi:serine/threonine protein kinase
VKILAEHNNLEAFSEELRQLRALHHKNIMHCFGGGVWDESGRMFFVMELCTRGDLSKLLLDMDLVAVDWPVVRSLAIQIAEVSFVF